MAEFLQQCGSWGVLATLAAYAAGVWVNRKTGKALFNPLLMGSIFMIVFLSCFGVPYADYKSSAQPVSWLLMPATVSLAIPLYEKWELLEKNLAAIFASIAAGVLTSLGSVLAMAWVLKLERAHAVSFLPKSVTTAIGMDVAETLGGTAALAGAVIILTGIVGSLLGETVCKVCHITDPLAKGLALGTSAHAIGTSKALQMGEIEGAMSGLAIAVAGIMTAILAPVVSAITHLIGMILAAIVSIPLIIKSFLSGDYVRIISLIIFTISMIGLYGASTAYHSFNISPTINKKLKKLDHAMIFVLIAGSYTPICTIVLGNTLGYGLLSVIWIIAILGIVFKMFWVTCPKWVSSVMYIAMGWLCIVAIAPIIHSLSKTSFGWLLAGGIIYTVGGVIYALKIPWFENHWKNFGLHEIFHLFVMGGSLCHMILMFQI